MSLLKCQRMLLRSSQGSSWSKHIQTNKIKYRNIEILTRNHLKLQRKSTSFKEFTLLALPFCLLLEP